MRNKRRDFQCGLAIVLSVLIIVLSACKQMIEAPISQTEGEISFTFVIDPERDSVEVEADDGWLDTQATDPAACGTKRVLKADVDVEVLNLEVVKWNKKYKVSAQFKNISSYTYKDMTFINPSYNGRTTPQLKPGQVTGVKHFFVDSQSQTELFSVQVRARAFVICNASQSQNANLEVSQVESADPVSPGDTLSYTVTIGNKGPKVAKNVIFRDILRAQDGIALTLLSSELDGRSTHSIDSCQAIKGGIRCKLGDLARHETRTYIVRLRVSEAMTQQGQDADNPYQLSLNQDGIDPSFDPSYSFSQLAAQRADPKKASPTASPNHLGYVFNKAIVGSANDPNPSNNRSVEKTQVKRGSTTPPPSPYVDLAITKTGSATANTTEQVSYLISVINNGTQPATGIVVEDYLYFEEAIFDGANGFCTYSYGSDATGSYQEAECTLPNPLAPGESISFEVYASFAAPGTAINQVEVSSNEGETAARLRDNRAEVSTQIVQPSPDTAAFRIRKTVRLAGGGAIPANTSIPDFTFNWSCNNNMTSGSITIPGTELADGSQTVKVRDVPIGTVCEATEDSNLADGWMLVGDPMLSQTIAAPRTTLVFVNEYAPTVQTGKIVIIKDTVPNDGQDFEFGVAAGLIPSRFFLDDDDDPSLPNMQTFDNVPPGSYPFVEFEAAGYLQTVSCDDPDGETVINAATSGAGVTIDLDAGETVSCTFSNTKEPETAAFNITKEVRLAGGGMIPANVSIPDVSFSWACNDGMTTGQTTISGSDLADGSETVTVRTVPAGVVCEASEVLSGLPSGWSISGDAMKSSAINSPSTALGFINEYTPPVSGPFVDLYLSFRGDARAPTNYPASYEFEVKNNGTQTATNNILSVFLYTPAANITDFYFDDFGGLSCGSLVSGSDAQGGFQKAECSLPNDLASGRSFLNGYLSFRFANTGNVPIRAEVHSNEGETPARHIDNVASLSTEIVPSVMDGVNFWIQKQIRLAPSVGSGAIPANAIIPDVTFDWSCDDGSSGNLTISSARLKDNNFETVLVKQVARGTTCNVTERVAELPDDWQIYGETTKSQVFNSQGTIVFVNEYAPDPVAGEADLRMFKEIIDQDYYLAGDTISYFLDVTNLSAVNAAENIVVTDDLPASLSFVRFGAGNAGDCSEAANTVTCNFGTLEPGSSTFVELVVKIDDNAVKDQIIRNTASVSSSTADPIPGNNADTVSIRIRIPEADIKVNKTVVTAGPYAPGDEIEYELAVANTDTVEQFDIFPFPADDVVLSDMLPSGVSYLSSEVNGTTASCSEASGTVTCDLGTLDGFSIDEVYIYIKVRINDDASGTLVNTATVSTSTPDPDPADNSSSVAIEVITP